MLLAIGMLTLAIVSAALFVAGAHRNSQITALQSHGVKVEETVSTCIGLLGGSGSNIAGYQCQGTIVLNGHRYEDPVPGDAPHNPRSKVVVVVDSENPGLVESVASANGDRTSATVFIVPTILLIVLALLVGVVLIRRRSGGPLLVGRLRPHTAARG